MWTRIVLVLLWLYWHIFPSSIPIDWSVYLTVSQVGTFKQSPSSAIAQPILQFELLDLSGHQIVSLNNKEWNLYPPHLFSYLLYKSVSLFLKTLSHNFRNVPIISNLFSKYRNSITVQSGEENENEEFVQE